MVSTPVIAFGSTPGGTGTAKRAGVLTAAVDIVPGTAVTSACAGPRDRRAARPRAARERADQRPRPARGARAVGLPARQPPGPRCGHRGLSDRCSDGDTVRLARHLHLIGLARTDLESTSWLGTSTSTPRTRRQRLLQQVVDALRDDDALIAYPTDSGYALGCRIGNRDGRDRILRIRGLDDRHHFTLVCKDFSQLGQLVHVDNAAFRAIRAATPGPYTFILPATPEVPRRLLHPQEAHRRGADPRPRAWCTRCSTCSASRCSRSTLILPGETEPRTMGWDIKEELDHVGRPRHRGRRDPGRADHGHRLVGGRARGDAGRRGRPEPLRRLSSRGSAPAANRSRTARQARQRA